MTRRILLALSTSRYSQHLVAHALNEAKWLADLGGGVLIDVLYVFEKSELDRVQRSAGEEGFLGLSSQKDLVKALGDEHHRMAQVRIDEVREGIKGRGFELEVMEVEGSFADSVKAQAQAVDYDIILLTRTKRPFISRLLFGGEADEVARWAREESSGQVIIDED